MTVFPKRNLSAEPAARDLRRSGLHRRLSHGHVPRPRSGRGAFCMGRMSPWYFLHYSK
jgi:hypothetical protein